MGYNVAIDGPAGAGKSTIAKLVAKEKGYIAEIKVKKNIWGCLSLRVFEYLKMYLISIQN